MVHVLRDIIKTVATRCHILKLKCIKFDFGWSFAPTPPGAYSTPPDRLAGFKGATCKRKDGKGREKGGEGKTTASQTCVFDAVSEPTCSLNTSLPGNWALESDAIEISCTVEYWGSWKPNVSCVPDAPARVIEELDYDDYNKTFRRVSYVRVVAAADIADRAVIICHTTFFRPAWEKTPEQIDTIPEGPQYHHTWKSSPIHVFNTTGSADHRPRQMSVRNFSTRSS